MDGMNRSKPRGVVAPLSFMEPMADKPYSYNYNPPFGVPVRNSALVDREVMVHDARSINAELSLDREGFVMTTPHGQRLSGCAT
jgi:hypothetical protein